MRAILEQSQATSTSTASASASINIGTWWRTTTYHYRRRSNIPPITRLGTSTSPWMTAWTEISLVSSSTVIRNKTWTIPTPTSLCLRVLPHKMLTSVLSTTNPIQVVWTTSILLISATTPASWPTARAARALTNLCLCHPTSLLGPPRKICRLPTTCCRLSGTLTSRRTEKSATSIQHWATKTSPCRNSWISCTSMSLVWTGSSTSWLTLKFFTSTRHRGRFFMFVHICSSRDSTKKG